MKYFKDGAFIKRREKKTIRSLREFPYEKSFNIEMQILYIEKKVITYRKNGQKIINVQFLAGD